MAHSAATRSALRAAYVFDRLPLEQAALRVSVAIGTAARWKKQARAAGDDWDKVRAANSLAGGGVEDVARQMLTDYMQQHQAMMEGIIALPAAEAGQKVTLLASLADSFNKIVAACRRVLPETNELAIALETLKLFREFVVESHPHNAETFAEILEPFGVYLAQHFSRRKGV
ncbi:DUF1804 family protein [Desulfovibrio sp. OttesenSCG-928-G15]|nr:DUF1804 family protein [Desulfovibrio sp. OttesenSCG-928-G15]